MWSITRILEHFAAHLVIDSDTQCWIWKDWHDKDGYSLIKINGKLTRVHRVSYELFNGPIPIDLTIDHLCRTRACINPTHLEAVTRTINVLRGIGPTAMNSRKLACLHGHLFTLENTYLYHGWRMCKVCRGIYYKKHKPEKQQQTALP